MSGFGIAAVLWFAVTGRLSWYVHPRYLWFTVALCALAAVALIAAVPAVLRAQRDEQAADQHGAEHASPQGVERESDRRGARVARATAAVLLVGGSAGALLIAPPATLSATAALQRDAAGSAGGGVSGAGPGSGGSDSAAAHPDDAELDARDWAMLLRQNAGAGVEGRTASFIGFVLPGSSADLFTAARFVVSCCAVDAQPLGVPVLSPAWEDDHAAGSWVEVEGVFIANPDVASDQPVVLRPFEVTAIDAPKDPYVY
ncbi:TIGR03943 family putative permease subunit [Leucobacter sp. USHLN153]|uniref:TIGR03943 family putative permease subunit n=1 Tax=Leucobacter sp. USHLN153 TaxID=3081268 RepID=UPI003015F9B3